MSTQPDTIEREETLELISTEEEETFSADLHHIGCCMWQLFALTHQKHYALCGALLEGDPDWSSKPNCEVCIRIEADPKGRVCPQITFGEGF
ncbi:MAG TPA: hypothetical protein VIT65_13830 [Microlunatus sp.]